MNKKRLTCNVFHCVLVSVCRFTDFLALFVTAVTPLIKRSDQAVSSRFQVILRGVFVFYTPGGLGRKRRLWSKFCTIEDIVVSYASMVEIPFF